MFLVKLWFRFLLYLFGIRFYKTECVPKSPEFRKAQFVNDHGLEIQFFFYKEECEDLIFRRGRIRKEKFIGYVIQAKFPDHMPEIFTRYNNLKFFFNSNNIFLRNEEHIVEALLSIYLDFIHGEIEASFSKDSVS